MDVRLRIRDRDHGRRHTMTIYGPTVIAVKRAFFLVVEASARTTDTYVCTYVRDWWLVPSRIGGLYPVGLED